MKALRAAAAMLLAGLLLATCARTDTSASAATTNRLVLTSMQATYSIAMALTAGTSIQVQNIPPDGREMSVQKDYIDRRKEDLAPQFAAASAVITITNAIPSDPLYRYAREANIRIVNIDAASPWSLDRPGVALADSPVSNVTWGKNADPAEADASPYFWLSLSNTIRMGDLVAHDLAALFPDSAAAIARNLDDFKRSMLKLRGEYQDSLMEAGGDVFALTGDFVYLTNDMGLRVDGYFIKQDVRWTRTDLDGLTRHLREHGIRVVLHKWMPDEPLQEAVKAAGAAIAVLETGDPGIVENDSLAADGLQRILKKNLDAIQTSLTALPDGP